jgi:16S rRNA processing protein RimM
VSPLLVLGRVVGAHGVRGWLKIHSFTDPPEALLDYQPWVLRAANGLSSRCTVREAEFDGQRIRVALQGIDDRNAAELLRGQEIAVARGALPPVKDKEYYQQDLLGFEVCNLEGVRLGQLSHFVDGTSQPTMAVTGEHERWVPAMPPYLRRVDLVARQVVVDWPAAD